MKRPMILNCLSGSKRSMAAHLFAARGKPKYGNPSTTMTAPMTLSIKTTDP